MSGRMHDTSALGAWSGAAAPGNHDAELLRLGALLAHTWRVAHHLWNASEAVGEAGGAREEAEALDKLAEDKAGEAFEIETAIAAMPAYTLEGVIVKLRAGRYGLVREHGKPGPADQPLDPDALPTAGGVLLSVLADLERMTREGQP